MATQHTKNKITKTATTITGQIRKLAFEILENKPEGIRYSDLKRNILEHNSSFNPNTIGGATWDLDIQYPEKVYKPVRGVFRLLKFKEEVLTQPDEQPTPKIVSKTKSISEEDFYKPFADWLVNELEECTNAIALGGNIFRDKWGTPDVVGVRESKRSDIIQFPTEIISGEIKIDSNGLITAFGQACAYKIFSHKSYIVVPNDSQIEDITRLDTLCRQFGLGLILFDNKKPEDPNFEIRARAVKHEPDMFFVNKNLKIIEDKLFK
ncbi:MAG: hypothetical protein A2X61_14200 [Ignavibacteria bacterium GWB2_35_12]|nr:MAG: hypothetical protein A2X63_10440 [Ignavibacteria bacterium GWA2_35_8]OGU41256.1 MAG: hypothetical protein A2X61_14200 [Ignavibacteria bacterium GWB2_35_12]OGU93288.1 MAG: hypothetical protein A2220_15025 [Ignavibacteria bacterium RIFOXYA2_FULL_35_10]OGV23180.1 MAG: hypothetical protein A2475_17530 [Ignavibacteria bacterium RIFOXYC2_FULL_35_21]